MTKSEKIILIFANLVKAKKIKMYEVTKKQLQIATGINQRSLNRYLNEIKKSGLIDFKQVYKSNKYNVLIKF